MANDYFDKVCEDPRTKIRLARNVSVNDLWDMRERIVIPHRTRSRRLLEFYWSFYDFISLVHEEGVVANKWNHPYAEYLKGYHHQWEAGDNRFVNSFRRRLDSAVDLYHSIKEEGMRDPLGMIVEDGKTFLYRGYRRLVILKVLGVKTAKVEYAIVYSYCGAQQPRNSEEAGAPL